MPLASTRMKRGEAQSRRGNRMNKGKKWQISMIKAVGANPQVLLQTSCPQRHVAMAGHMFDCRDLGQQLLLAPAR